MSEYEQKGYDAFVEELSRMPKHMLPTPRHAFYAIPPECKVGSTNTKRTEWLRGWQKAREDA